MIYLYWGNRILSFLRYMGLYSCCKFGDNVTLILRKEENKDQLKVRQVWHEEQDFFSYEGINYFEHVSKLPLTIEYLEDEYPDIAELNAPEVQTFDLLKWKILATKGGVLVDLDIIFFKPIPEITHDIEIIIFDKYPKKGYIPVSYMQGRPSKWWEEQYHKALKNYNFNKYESCGNDILKYTLKDIQRHDKNATLKRLPSKLVMPFAETHEWKYYHDMTFKEVHPLPEECVGIHWYGGANQSYNNYYTHYNFRKNDCTISRVIESIYESIDF